ncbi:MAG: hypothetical protein HRU15_13505 [Planctomycetes bacterium]|nr:hypothetical protein [Planctomycetota bacterium]
MSKSQLTRNGVILLVIATVIGFIPGVSALLSATDGNIDSTQQATDVGGALAILCMMIPVAIAGLALIIIASNKGNDEG